jgi:hypothetical protein
MRDESDTKWWRMDMVASYTDIIAAIMLLLLLVVVVLILKLFHLITELHVSVGRG